MDLKRRNLIFLEAGFLTILVFFSAVIANEFLDERRAQSIDNKLFEASIEQDSFIALEVFQETFNSSSCELRKGKIFEHFAELKKVGTDVSNFGKLFLKSNENLSKLKQREYFLSQLDLYLYTIGYNQVCEEDVFPIIYFFNGLSTELDKQSIILEQFSINNKNETIIVSFDYFYDGEIVLEMFKNKYNITTTPFVILNNLTSTQLSKNNEGIISLNTIAVEYLKYRGEI